MTPWREGGMFSPSACSSPSILPSSSKFCYYIYIFMFLADFLGSTFLLCWRGAEAETKYYQSWYHFVAKHVILSGMTCCGGQLAHDLYNYRVWSRQAGRHAMSNREADDCSQESIHLSCVGQAATACVWIAHLLYQQACWSWPHGCRRGNFRESSERFLYWEPPLFWAEAGRQIGAIQGDLI